MIGQESRMLNTKCSPLTVRMCCIAAAAPTDAGKSGKAATVSSLTPLCVTPLQHSYNAEYGVVILLLLIKRKRDFAHVSVRVMNSYLTSSEGFRLAKLIMPFGRFILAYVSDPSLTMPELP